MRVLEGGETVTMTVRQAKATIALQRNVHRAVAQYRKSTAGSATRNWDETYFLSFLLMAVDGHSYGSAPIERAHDRLDATVDQSDESERALRYAEGGQ